MQKKKSPRVKKRYSGGGQGKGRISGIMSTLGTTITTMTENFGRGAQANNSLTFEEQKQLIDLQSGPDVNVAILDFTNNYSDNLTTDEKITFKEYLIDNPKKCSMFEKFGHEEKIAYIRKTLIIA